MANYTSKKGTLSYPSITLFDRLTDLSGLLSSLPEDKRNYVTLEDDKIKVEYAGFSMSVRLKEKIPFNLVVYEGAEGAPFHFTVTFHLDPAEMPGETVFWIEADADLNFMMRSLLSGKIQEGLDKVVDAVVSGQVPYSND